MGINESICSLYHKFDIFGRRTLLKELYTPPVTTRIIQPALLALAVVTALGGGVRFAHLQGNIAVPIAGGTNRGSGTEGESGVSGNSGQSATTSSPVKACMIRQFTCGKGSLSSCYKRWRSIGIDCMDRACGSGGCIVSDKFFSTYKLEPWDTGALPGPFPRSETMCIMQLSACLPGDPFCLSPISLEQVPCEDSRCGSATCTRMAVFVDQTDTIVSDLPAAGTTPGGKPAIATDGNNGDRGDTKGKSDSHDNEGTSDQSAKSEQIKKISAETTAILGCFDASGTWTTDRTRCAINQKPFVEPKAAESAEKQESADNKEEEKILVRVIESQFVPDTRKLALVQNLLSSTNEASGRISRLLENPNLPPDVRTELNLQFETLRSVQQSASTDSQSVRDVQLLADVVATQLNEAQQTVNAWKASMPRNIPVTVTDKLDRIFAALPSVFGVLQQEGMTVDASTIDQYIQSQELYDVIHADCVNNSASCANLSKVIDALEPVFASIHLLLETAGRTDLEEKIDAVLMQ